GIPMQQTRSANDNMESILDVDGIARVYIGPSDLGFSYGLVPKLDRDEPEILKIYDKIPKQRDKRKIYAGIHTGGAAYASRAIGMGYRLGTIMNDRGLMA